MEKSDLNLLYTFASGFELLKMQQKISTKEDYLKRINTVIEYISNNLEENIDLKTLASVSNFSSFHFQRIMKAFLGEPIGTFIVRMRLETAAQLIRHSDLPINEIAFKVGYNTPSSLSKVFKQFYGISPTEYRTNKKYIIMRPLQVNPDLKIEYKVANIKAFQVAYIQLFGDYKTLNYTESYKKLWGYVQKNNLFSDGIENIAINYDNPQIVESGKIRADCCLTIHKDAKPENEIGVKTISGGNFLVSRYKGTYKNLASVYDTIFKYIPECGYVLRDSFSFDKYLNHPEQVPEDELLTEIYIPIE